MLRTFQSSFQMVESWIALVYPHRPAGLVALPAFSAS